MWSDQSERNQRLYWRYALLLSIPEDWRAVLLSIQTSIPVQREMFLIVPL